MTLLEETFSVHRLAPDAPLSAAINEWDFYSLSKTVDELSLVCTEYLAVKSVKHSPDWKCLKVTSPLDFKLTGIITGITDIIEKERVSVFVISTFDTDYILIKKQNLTNTIYALERAGYQIN